MCIFEKFSLYLTYRWVSVLERHCPEQSLEVRNRGRLFVPWIIYLFILR